MTSTSAGSASNSVRSTPVVGTYAPPAGAVPAAALWTPHSPPAPSLRITYVGHATTLVEIGAARILTDPNFDAQLSRLPFLASRTARVAAPPVLPQQLPPLDAIILTHAHQDHLSFDSLAALPRDVPVYAPPALARWLRRRGHTTAEALAAGDTLTLECGGKRDVTISAAAAKHSGARHGLDLWRAATNLYLLDDGTRSCFFAGDTALTPRAAGLVDERLRRRGRELDAAILPLSYAPWWHPGLRAGHLTYEDALRLFEQLGARHLVPCHWGTFRFPDSGPFDAIIRLRKALPTYPLAHRVHIVEPGSALEIPPCTVVTGC